VGPAGANVEYVMSILLGLRVPFELQTITKQGLAGDL